MITLGKIVAYLHKHTVTDGDTQNKKTKLSFEKKPPYTVENGGKVETVVLVSQSDYLMTARELTATQEELDATTKVMDTLAMRLAQQLYFADNALETTDKLDLRDTNAATQKQYIDKAMAIGRGQ